MFTVQSEEAYREACRPAAWESVRKVADRCSAARTGRDLRTEEIEPLPWPRWRIAQNEVLVAGMPLSALPVESLYRPWSSAQGNDYGAQKGLYLGDAAHHMQAIYEMLGIEVPKAFAASPDHLSLLLDLLVLFIENGNEKAARSLAADHFDWLDAYDAALEARDEAACSAARLDGERRAAVREGIAHLRALAALAGCLVRAIAQSSAASHAADACESAQAAHASAACIQKERLAACGDVR